MCKRILCGLLFVICLLAALTAAAKPRLVPIADGSTGTSKSSNPSSLTRVGSLVFFTANDASHGTELWRTDGTTAGTQMVIDLRAGLDASNPRIVGTFGNAVLFRAAASGQTDALWRSDGTVAGTIRLFVGPKTGLDRMEVFPSGPRIFIILKFNDSPLMDIWVSDGAVDDARRIGSVQEGWPGTRNAVGGKLYFMAADAVLGAQFWVSDGTLLGTHLLNQGVECVGNGDPCGPIPTGGIFNVGTQALFGTTEALWKTDGTAAGTVRIATTPVTVPVVTSQSVAYFESGDSLWKTNGTAAGTIAVAGPPTPVSAVQALFLYDGRMVYWSAHPFDQLWRTDGTTTGTQSFSSMPSNGFILGSLGTRVLLSGRSKAAGTELWYADVDGGSATLLKDIDARIGSMNLGLSSAPYDPVTLGTQFLFSAADARGRELWSSDGTASGTQLLADIAPEPGGGIVSGTVREFVTNTVLGGATVRLCTSTGCDVQVATDPDGKFRFDGVLPGTYTASVSNHPHISQLYNGIDCAPSCALNAGTSFEVVSGFETQGIDFSLRTGAVITGHVTRASTGAPVHAEVFIVDSTGSTADVVFTDALGAYRSKVLANGTYTVHSSLARWGSPPLVDQLFRGVDCFPDETCESYVGEPVTVMGNDASGIDLALHEFGRIAGTVRDASTGLAVPYAQVTFTTVPETSAATIVADVNGTYLSPLVYPGTYRAIASLAGFSMTAYPDIDCIEWPCGTPLSVAIGTTTSGIDITMPPSTARLTGAVTTSDGVPASNVQVQLLDAAGNYSGFATRTTGDGRYALNGMPAGTYYILASDELIPNIVCSSFPCDTTNAMPVTIVALNTTAKDVQLTARYTTVSGRLFDAATGLAMSQGAVALYDSTKSSVTYIYGVSPSGDYSVKVLSRSPTFYAVAIADGYHRTVYPAASFGSTFPASATPLLPGTHSGIDISMRRYGTISGRVVDAATGIASPQWFTVVFQNSADPTEIKSVGTENDGSYHFEEADGSYYVYAEEVDYNGQVYPDLDCAGDCVPTSGGLVTVASGGSVTGIDFHLTRRIPMGRITGRVVDHVTGAGIAGALVTALGASYAWTDAQGYYAVNNLEPGPHRLYASRFPDFTSLYGGSICTPGLPCDYNTATAVAVTASETTPNIDFRLIHPSITGISPNNGAVTGNTLVAIYGANFTAQTTVTIGGRSATLVSIASTQIVARTPSGIAGPAHVLVKIGWLGVSLPHAFAYTLSFTDETLTAGASRIKPAHITELRDAINALRVTANLAPTVFTDPSLAGVKIRAVHLLELRTALSQARSALGRSPMTYSNPLTVSSVIRALDITELRNGVR